MKKISPILLLILFVSTNLFSQESPSLNNEEPCATDLLHQRLLQTDPHYKSRFNNYQNLVANGNVAIPKLPILTIPVVFHVMHLGEAVGTGTNISQEQIHSALASLNDAYRGLAPYSSSGVDMEIEFRLASQDPFGNPTTGINRVNASGTSDYATNGITSSGSNNEVAIKALSKWSNTDYYNIWVVSEIDGNDAGGGTQGYAYFPGAGPTVDGTVILFNALGYDPTGSRCLNVKSYTSYNVTLIHELGHGLGLYHTFEGDANGTVCPANANCNTDGDQICDTPPHERTNSGCPTGTLNMCGTLRDNHMHNFMDYSSDACQTEFTADQKTRARAFLSGSRPGLLSSSGYTPVAVPISDFASECGSNSGCSGTAIQFYDLSTYDPTSWSWSFPGGTPNISSAQHPLINYAAPGVYNVSLQATNGSGAGSVKTVTGYITIYDTPTAACTPGIQNVGFYGYSFSNVTFDDINNNTSPVDNGYTDFSCQHIATVNEGQTYSLSITVGNSGGQDGFYNCYIDYDDDGTFSAGESVLSGSTVAGSGYQTFSQNVTIPAATVQNDLLRMRVINDQFNLAGPCDNLFTGEAEDYGVYIIGPLPVELINFTAQAMNDRFVALHWQTASEKNNDYFTVERSVDVKNWKEISIIDGAGNSTTLLNYATNDNNPYAGVAYYRIKQTDFDGQFSYSPIRSVTVGQADNIPLIIYPNPAKDFITINGSSEELEAVVIYNTLGQNVMQLTTEKDKTKSQLVIDISNLNSGIYYVKTKTTTNKVSKQ